VEKWTSRHRRDFVQAEDFVLALDKVIRLDEVPALDKVEAVHFHFSAFSAST
jgi:hypothetical protein